MRLVSVGLRLKQQLLGGHQGDNVTSIFVMMGVTGSGKTTIGQLLAARLHVQFADGDDFHSAANKAKLTSGTALTDEDRAPWLQRLNQLLLQWSVAGQGGVLACSALKANYRETLQQGMPEGAVVFVLLEAPKGVIQGRLAHRREHFMNPGLLDSQIATLEDPGQGLLHVCNDGVPEQTVQTVIADLGLAQPGN